METLSKRERERERERQRERQRERGREGRKETRHQRQTQHQRDIQQPVPAMLGLLRTLTSVCTQLVHHRAQGEVQQKSPASPAWKRLGLGGER
jgi:hypothetical protein